jgi:Na+/H+-dicarboxylate symporter
MSRKKKQTNREYTLTGHDIDALSELLDSELRELGTELQNRLRIRLTVEESLLRLRDKFGEETTVNFIVSSMFGRPYIQIEHEGEMFNPLSKTQVELEDWSGSLLTSVGLSPTYSYSRGRNVLRLMLPAKRMNPAIKVIIMIAAGIILGMIGNMMLSAGANSLVTEEVLMPVFEMWNRLLLVLSGPVIFLMVVTTVLNTGAISEQGGNTLIVTARYFLISIFVSLFAVIIAHPLFGPQMAHQSASDIDGAGFFESVLGVVPDNFLAPVIDANTPQILLMALIVGNALVVAGSKVDGLVGIVKQANMVGLLLCEWVSRLVPYFAGIFVAMEVMQKRTRLLTGIWQPLLVSLLISAVLTALVLFYFSRKNKVGFKVLFDKVMPPFRTAVRAGTLDASFGQAESSCINRLGIEKHYTTVGMPHGLVLYMPVNVLGTMVFIVYAAHEYGMSVTPVWYVGAMILAVVLIVATPPVPGANLIAYIVLFAQLGIGSQVLIDAMIFDILFGIIASAANQLLLQLELASQADKIGLLDRDRLRAA